MKIGKSERKELTYKELILIEKKREERKGALILAVFYILKIAAIIAVVAGFASTIAMIVLKVEGIIEWSVWGCLLFAVAAIGAGCLLGFLLGGLAFLIVFISFVYELGRYG